MDLKELIEDGKKTAEEKVVLIGLEAFKDVIAAESAKDELSQKLSSVRETLALASAALESFDPLLVEQAKVALANVTGDGKKQRVAKIQRQIEALQSEKDELEGKPREVVELDPTKNAIRHGGITDN